MGKLEILSQHICSTPLQVIDKFSNTIWSPARLAGLFFLCRLCRMLKDLSLCEVDFAICFMKLNEELYLYVSNLTK